MYLTWFHHSSAGVAIRLDPLGSVMKLLVASSSPMQKPWHGSNECMEEPLTQIILKISQSRGTSPKSFTTTATPMTLSRYGLRVRGCMTHCLSLSGLVGTL